MKNKDIKSSLQNAVSDITPDFFDKIISSPIPEADKQTPMRFTLVKPSVLNIAMVIAACIVVVFVGMNIFKPKQQDVGTVIMIDINPSISIHANDKGSVISCESINSDAQDIVDKLQLEQTNITSAVTMVVDSLVDEGYLEKKKHSAMLVSVEGGNEKVAKKVLKEAVADISDSVLRNKVKTKILSQTIEKSENTKKKSGKYGISVGKATYINKIIDKDSSLEFKKLAVMTIKEIDNLTQKKKIKMTDSVEVEVFGYKDESVDDSNNSSNDNVSSLDQDGEEPEPLEEVGIGSEDCKNIAISDAGSSIDNISELKIYLNNESGNVYEIEFTSDETRYFYLVNAETGEIISSYNSDEYPESSKTTNDGTDGESSEITSSEPTGSTITTETSSSIVSSKETTEKLISANDAKIIAIAYVGAMSDKNLHSTVKLIDREYYLVEIKIAGVLRTAKINARTGSIIN